MNRVDFIDWLHTEIDAVFYGKQSKEQLLLKAIPMVDLMLQKCEQAHVSGSLPLHKCPVCGENAGKTYIAAKLPTVCQCCDHIWMRG